MRPRSNGAGGATGRGGAAGHPLRVLAQPAFKRRELNPYPWQLAVSLQAAGAQVAECSPAALLRGGHDVWHLHWPDAHLNQSLARACCRSLALMGLLRLARARGTRIVWTVHNLRTHERRHPALEERFHRRFLPLVDGVISLTRQGDAAAVARYPSLARVPRFVIPHGDYRRLYPNVVDRAEARDRLGLAPGARVIAFLGHVREYKNVPELVAAARALPDPDLRVVVAGRPASAGLAARIRAAAENDPRIQLQLELVPTADVQLVLNAADLVVLPYREILNSGSALLALSFDRPVLLPRAGALPELQGSVGPEWVRLYAGPLDPGELAAALHWARTAGRAERAPLEAFAWERIAEATLAAYREIAQTDADRGPVPAERR